VLENPGRAWSEFMLDQQQRFQRMVYPEGMTYERPGRIGTAVTSPVFRYLCAIRSEKKLWYENRARVAPSRRAAAEPRLKPAALRGSRPVRTRVEPYRAGWKW
jgi:hypothetical protein